jgi:hypothetical protein
MMTTHVRSSRHSAGPSTLVRTRFSYRSSTQAATGGGGGGQAARGATAKRKATAQRKRNNRESQARYRERCRAQAAELQARVGALDAQLKAAAGREAGLQAENARLRAALAALECPEGPLARPRDACSASCTATLRLTGFLGSRARCIRLLVRRKAIVALRKACMRCESHCHALQDELQTAAASVCRGDDEVAKVRAEYEAAVAATAAFKSDIHRLLAHAGIATTHARCAPTMSRRVYVLSTWHSHHAGDCKQPVFAVAFVAA